MSLAAPHPGPLAGLNVIDFGWYYAGPMAGMLLADQGANVIRVVRPGAPELPPQQYRVLNRNKKLLTLDLKMEDGRRRALSLVARADVVIENFRPGVMDRLGLGYESAKKLNGELIYLSLPGFASTDTERARLQAWEGVLSAAACMYSEMSFLRRELQLPPLYTPIAQCSVFGALHGCIAVMAALIARRRCGLGSFIEAPLVDCAFSGYPVDFLTKRLGDVYATSRNPSRVNHGLTSGETTDGSSRPLVLDPHHTHNHLSKSLGEGWAASQQRVHPAARYYSCADGRKIAFFGGLFPKWSSRFYQILGIHEELLRHGFVNAGSWVTGLGNNLSSYGGLEERFAARLEQLIAQAVRTRTAEDWETLLAEEVLVLVPRTREEWLLLEPMLKSGVLVSMDDGRSELIAPGRAVDVSGPNGALMEGFRELEFIAPEQADELFSGPKSSPGAQRTVVGLKKGELLEGLRILDMANILAGPSATYFLAQYGAQVTKVDPTETVPHLLKVILEGNQGKRSLVADLKSAPGQELLRRLVRHADVVMHNILDDTALSLGVTHDQLKAINPDVVTCQLSCYGGSTRDAWEKRLGIDTMAQAVSGLLAKFGSLDQPQSHGGAAAADITTALGFAFSALVGVWQKGQFGYAGEARTSLVRMVNYYQLPWMIAQNGTATWGEGQGQNSVGESWRYRLYRCADGWLFVAAIAESGFRLAQVVCGTVDATERDLEDAFEGRDCSDWTARLDAVGIASHPVLNMNDVCSSERLHSVGNESADETVSGALVVTIREQHPCGEPIILPDPTWTRVGHPQSYTRLAPAPWYGQHTREILQELGYSGAEKADLLRLEVVYEYLPHLGREGVYF